MEASCGREVAGPSSTDRMGSLQISHSGGSVGAGDDSVCVDTVAAAGLELAAGSSCFVRPKTMDR